MIELLLQAERALAVGLVDQAERMYRQAATADPQNSIAVVGLARVALERGDEPEAWRQARRALGIDPENVAAQRLAARLEEVWAYRGQSLPEVAGGEPAAPEAVPSPEADPAPEAVSPPGAEPSLPSMPMPAEPSIPPTSSTPSIPPTPSPTSPRSVVDRLLRRKRP